MNFLLKAEPNVKADHIAQALSSHSEHPQGQRCHNLPGLAQPLTILTVKSFHFIPLQCLSLHLMFVHSCPFTLQLKEQSGCLPACQLKVATKTPA